MAQHKQRQGTSRSRVSQRSLHRLGVATLSMSLRSRRAELPVVDLGLPQLDHYHDQAEKALSETIAAYQMQQQHINQAKWKCLRSRSGVQLFRDRQLTRTRQVPVLCVGILRGSFDDIMEGIYCQNTEEMLLMNAIKCPKLAESAVLYNVQRQTMCESYAFTGIKWTTIKLSVASNRDFCYFDKMGMVRHTSGNRMAYHVMQSVDIPEYPEKATHKRLQASLCYVFEELENDLVSVYMQGKIDNAALSYFAMPAVLDLLMEITNAMECTRAKKLAEMMAVAPPGHWKRRSTRKCCDVCRNSPLFFESLQKCAGCHFQYVCKKCRLKENVLARDTTSSSHLMRAEFCRVCIAQMDATSIEELRAKSGAFSVAGQRMADKNAAFCKVDDAEEVDIPGSDRSLTAFTLKITAQMQDVSRRSDICASLEKVSISDEEDEILGEDRDVLNSIGKKCSRYVSLDKEPTDASRCSSRSTTSTASSSLYHDDIESEQYRTSIFTRLLQMSNQVEATFHLTQEQSLLAHTLPETPQPATSSLSGIRATLTTKVRKSLRKLMVVKLCDANSVTQTPAETRKAISGRDIPEFNSAPPAKKRKRRDKMPRIWLRLELFELGIVPIPSKYAASLTLNNVKKALNVLHNKLQAANRDPADVASIDDAVMLDVEGCFTESDNFSYITFAVWKDAVENVFQWREQDYKAFWLLLVQFHRMIHVKKEVIDATVPLDSEQCFEREEVPVYKVAIFLFIQTVKPHSWRTKYSLDSFNAVWYRGHAESLAAAAALEAAGAVAAATATKSPILSANGSPSIRGCTSPPPPQSPHTVGMADRSTADSYYLSFVREKLEDLFGLLYPSVDLKDESPTVMSADQIDLLGFLLCLGDVSLVDKNLKLSSCYPMWEQSCRADVTADTAHEYPPQVENGAKLCRFYKTHLSLNEKLYPPVGFSKPYPSAAQTNVSAHSPPAFSLNDDFSLDGSAEGPAPDEGTTGRSIVLSQLIKATVIKRAEEFAVFEDSGQRPDVMIFSCQDSYIYLLGLIRYPFNLLYSLLANFYACKNCRIITAPNTGILTMERCENVQVTSLSGLIRISNCLDARLNVYTLLPMIVSGENVGVVLGPYNTKFSGLKQQLSTAPFLFHAESQGSWNNFLDLDSDKDSMSDTDAAPVSLQVPETFREVCVPVKFAVGAGSAERPFPIPSEYAATVKKHHETVESLRQLVTSDEFDLTKKRTMEMVIQLKFKDWLSSSGNVRQVLDLVHLDRIANDPASK
ncbi:putative TBCC domain-containing protein [Plasmopara halstedii]